jgi:hypothetical protein
LPLACVCIALLAFHATFILIWIPANIMLRLPLILSFILLAGNAQAFVPVSHSAVRHKLHLNSIEPAGNSAIDDFLEDIKMRLRIAQESNASGVSKKQTLAAVIAGEYDSEAVEAKIDEAIASAPCGK